MNDTKDIKYKERRSSEASSISTTSAASRSSLTSKHANSSRSTRSSLSVASSASNAYALSHTLSSSGKYVDPLKRVEPFRVERIDNLELRLLDICQKAVPARLLSKEQAVKQDTSYKPKTFMLPAIASAMGVYFDASLQGLGKERFFIHLISCRRQPNDKMDAFIRACYVRLTEMDDSEQAYIRLPPCFFLSKVQFDMGHRPGFATFAWLSFDDQWVRKTIRSAKIVSIAGSLSRWRGYSDCDCSMGCYCPRAIATILVNAKINGQASQIEHQVSPEQVDSTKAFPEWLRSSDYQGFDDWCGTAQAARSGGRPYLKNPEVHNVKVNYFGDIVKLDLVRSPGAPESLPEPPQPVKKRGLFRSKR